MSPSLRSNHGLNGLIQKETVQSSLWITNHQSTHRPTDSNTASLLARIALFSTLVSAGAYLDRGWPSQRAWADHGYLHALGLQFNA